MLKSKKKYKDLIIKSTQVKKFCKLTKDRNPIHLNKKYLIKVSYNKLVAPAIFILAKINEIISEKYKGAIIIDIIGNFREPIFLNDKYKLYYKVNKINKSANIFQLTSIIKKNSNKVLAKINFIVPKILK